ncbi:MAG: cell division protein ZapA [Syntrophomonadaceae bacterium]|nr:cell division protein ZapA [Syntrophomonadaceae bacterium]
MRNKNELVKVTVNIFGEEYTIKGTEEPEYIERLAEIVDNQMQELHQKNPSLGISRLAILTALNLADQMGKLQEEYDRLSNQRKKRKDEKSLNPDNRIK